MKKAELEERLNNIEQELKELKTVLEMDAQEYADKINVENTWFDGKRQMTSSDTYPYRIGVAIGTINWILERR